MKHPGSFFKCKLTGNYCCFSYIILGRGRGKRKTQKQQIVNNALVLNKHKTKDHILIYLVWRDNDLLAIDLMVKGLLPHTYVIYFIIHIYSHIWYVFEVREFNTSEGCCTDHLVNSPWTGHARIDRGISKHLQIAKSVPGQEVELI